MYNTHLPFSKNTSCTRSDAAKYFDLDQNYCTIVLAFYEGGTRGGWRQVDCPPLINEI